MIPNGPFCSTCRLAGCRGERIEDSFLGSYFEHDEIPLSSNYTAAYGGMTSKVMIVHESMAQTPGRFLMGRAFSRKKWGKDEFKHAAILACHPEKGQIRDYKGNLLTGMSDAIDHCAQTLNMEIDRSQPKVIVTLGEMAFEGLTGLNRENTHFRKDFMKSVHGYAFREKQDRCWVVPTFDPNWIMKGNNAQTQVFLWDIDKARRMAREGYSYEHPTCLLDPPVAEWEAYVSRCCQFLQNTTLPRSERILAVDIENQTKRQYAEDESQIELVDSEGADVTYNIERVSFAFETSTGSSVPWSMPYLVGVAQILRVAAAHGLVIIWNRAHDRPRLMKALEMDLPVEWCEDAMIAWHVLYNSLDKGLGYATSCLPSSWKLPMWKHLSGSDEARYSAFDSIALLRNYKDTMRLLRSTGQMQCYRDTVTDIDPALFYMGQSGMLTNATKRDKLEGELEVMLAAFKQQMQEITPEEIRNVQVWQSLKAAEKSPVRARITGELYEVDGVSNETTCGACGAHPVTKAHVTRKTVEEVNVK